MEPYAVKFPEGLKMTEDEFFCLLPGEPSPGYEKNPAGKYDNQVTYRRRNRKN